MIEQFILLIKNIKNHLYQLSYYKRSIIVYSSILLFLSALAFYLSYLKNKDTQTKFSQKEQHFVHSNESNSLDTLIPKAHVLIPIEISNSESLDSIFGNYGWVNLYTSSGVGPNMANKLVAKHIKLIRSPYRADIFAVMVHEEKANQILQYSGPFSVSLQSPKNIGTKLEDNKSKPKTKRELRIEEI